VSVKTRLAHDVAEHSKYRDLWCECSLEDAEALLELVEALEVVERGGWSFPIRLGTALFRIIGEDVSVPHGEGWQTMDTAPKGLPMWTSTKGTWVCHGASEWFIGLTREGKVLKVRRAPDTVGHDWEDDENTRYYVDTALNGPWLLGWIPLPENTSIPYHGGLTDG